MAILSPSNLETMTYGRQGWSDIHDSNMQKINGWWDSNTEILVIDDFLAAQPGAPSDGDRYVATATAGDWTENNVYTWSDSSSSWEETAAYEGMHVYDKDSNYDFYYDGSSWVMIISPFVTVNSGFDNFWDVCLPELSTRNFYLDRTVDLVIVGANETSPYEYNNPTDYTTIAGTADGGLTITTLDAAAANAHITLKPDGHTYFTSDYASSHVMTDVDIDFYMIGAGTLTSPTDYTKFYVTSDGLFTIYTQDSDGVEGDIVLDPDGSIIVTPAIGENSYLQMSDSTEVYQYFQNSTTGSTEGDGSRIGLDADENMIIEQLESQDMYLKTYYGDVILDATGNVRIADTADLYLNGAGDANNPTDYTKFYVDTDGALTIMTVDSDGTEADLTLAIDGKFDLTTATDEDITLAASGTGNIILDPGGNVLIGATGTERLQGGSIGLGCTPPYLTSSRIQIDDSALNTVSDYSCVKIDWDKIAGNTDSSDDFKTFEAASDISHADNIGNYYAMDFTQYLSGGIVSSGKSMQGLRFTSNVNGGTITDGNLEAGYMRARINGGTAGGDIISLELYTDCDSGTVSGSIYGEKTLVDIESGMTSIGGSVYGKYIQVDADKAPAGSVYMLYLAEYDNIDYGIYQDGTATNLLGGELWIDSDSNGIKLGDGQTSEILDDGTDLTIQGNGDIYLDANGGNIIYERDVGYPQFRARAAATANYGVFSCESARGGSLSSPQALQNTDAVGSFAHRAYDGSGYDSVATFNCTATETHDANNHGVEAIIRTSANGENSMSDRIKIDSSGDTNIYNGDFYVREHNLYVEHTCDEARVQATTQCDTNLPYFTLRRSRDNAGSAEVLDNGDYLGQIEFQGYDGDYFDGANISAIATEDWVNGTDRGTKIVFKNVANNGTALAENLTIDHDGGIFMPNLKSGANQAAAGAAADELYHDTDDNTIKIGV